ncbi:hypothetical protein [Hirschia litorea]|uniref:Uncharacterized protein n=1 Tax=Hirschia litorea TaxID=1199156 RepID=A0ABW2IJ71_9PROT
MFSPRARFLSILLPAFGLAMPLSANADPTWPHLFKEAALPKSDATPAKVSYQSEIIQVDDEEWGKLVYQIENSAETGIKVRVETFPTEGDQADIEEELNEDQDGEIWCDDYNEIIGGPVELVSETDSEAIFSFNANADSAEDKQERKILGKTRITVNVDKSLKEITQFKYELTESVKPMMVAKIDTFELVGTCASHENGRPIVTKVATKITGRAMGQSFGQNSLQTFKNFTVSAQ